MVLILILLIGQYKYEYDQLYLSFLLEISILIKIGDYFVILIIETLSTYARHLSSKDATINKLLTSY